MAVILYLGFLALTSALCSFTQVCQNAPSDCTPPFKLDPPVAPFLANWTGTAACPEFLGQSVCCNNDQNLAMLYKYELLDTTFGHTVGGCDICAANLKRMWCYFTCSPEQSNFVSAGPQANVPNPIDPGTDILIMLNNFTVTNGLACELYNSCQKCPYVTEVSAMQSPQGFLEFQGYEGIPIGLLWTTFLFSDGPASLDMTFIPCEQNVTNAYGYPIVPCGCNNCESKCAGNYYVSQPSTLNGADWALVGFFYLGLLVVSIIILFIQYKLGKKKRPEVNERERPMRELEEDDG